MIETLPVPVTDRTRRSAIRVRGLTARTPDRVLVAGVDLDIAEGTVTAIIGSSGSGKTTTALALMGEHRPGVTLSMDRLDAAGVRFGTYHNTLPRYCAPPCESAQSSATSNAPPTGTGTGSRCPKHSNGPASRAMRPCCDATHTSSLVVNSNAW